MNASVVADGELHGPEDSNDRHECEDQDEDDFAEWDSRTGGGHTLRDARFAGLSAVSALRTSSGDAPRMYSPAI